MAREFIDGFESGGKDLWESMSGNTGVVTSASIPATGFTPYVLVAYGGGWVRRYVTARDSYYTASISSIVSDNYETYAFLRFMNGNTVLTSIGYTPVFGGTGKVVAYRGDMVNLIGTGTTVVQAQPYAPHRIECFCYPRTDGTGRLIVKLDGITQIDFTGQTANASGQINALAFGSSIRNTIHDNIVIDSSTWIGQTSIQALVPMGAGTFTQFTPSAGTNWSCVDEIPASDADYVYVNSNDQYDLYAMSNLTGTVNSIKSVQVQARAEYVGASTPKSLAVALRTAASIYDGQTQALSTIYGGVSQMWEKNPNTTLIWTPNDVNALECGIKSKA